MNLFYKLENRVQEYAWGDSKNIAEVLGVSNPKSKAMAELWMGAHPSAPSKLLDGEHSISLDRWISEHPETALGTELFSRYGRLPYLFKLLSAGQALSIQAHPNKKQAEEGFARENRLGIPRDAAKRNYRDDNHKPEIIMALTSFIAMIGFRSHAEIVSNMKAFIPETKSFAALNASLYKIEKPTPGSEEKSLSDFLEILLSIDRTPKDQLLQLAYVYAKSAAGKWNPLVNQWIPRLATQYPGDIGVLSPLFLNLVEIQPGEALYQPARVLHAYLSGFGVELMANSDNVLRGGLSSKHIDVPELIKILDFRPTRPDILLPLPAVKGKESGYSGSGSGSGSDGNGLFRFHTPAEEFMLALFKPDKSSEAKLTKGNGPRIVLVLQGTVTLSAETQKLILEKGESAFIPWDSPEMSISGSGRAVIAEVGKNEALD